MMEYNYAFEYFMIGMLSNYIIDKVLCYINIKRKESKMVSETMRLLNRIKVDSDIRLLESKILSRKDTIRTYKQELIDIKEKINEWKSMPRDTKNRDNELASLYTKEEQTEEELIELDTTQKNQEIELEELRELLDTLVELYQIEQKTDMRTEFERCIANYKKEIKQLNDLIKTKDKCIKQTYNSLYN